MYVYANIYLKGEMLSMFKRVASDMPTLSPTAIRGTSEMISMVPLAILVGMDRACENRRL